MTGAATGAGEKSIAVLSGGVGGAKLVLGLSLELPADRLVVLANVGDDFTHLGLHIAPDVDTIVYTLAGLADPERGWGRAGETWAFMEALGTLGGADWFTLGDGDLAMHIERTRRLGAGETLTQVTAALAQNLGVAVPILPMSDAPVATMVETASGPLAFQHYFVRDRCAPAVTGFRFHGIEEARPNPDFLRRIDAGTIGAVIIAPSNPYVSVDPILKLPGMKAALAGIPGPIIAVSPIIAGETVKGPAAKMMAELGIEASALAIGRHYAGFIDGLIIDEADHAQADAIAALGMRVKVTATMMRTLADRRALARDCLDFAAELAGEKPQ